MSHSIETLKSIFSDFELRILSDLQFGIEARYNDEMSIPEIAMYARRSEGKPYDVSFLNAFFERYFHEDFASAELAYADAAVEVAIFAVKDGIGWEPLLKSYFTDDDERAAFLERLIEEELTTVSELEGLYPAIFKFLEGRGLVWSED